MMKLIAFFVVASLAGAGVGAFYGGDIAASLMPAAGSHGAWYASRAAGIASYLFLWLGLAGGLLMSSAWFDGLLHRGRLLAVHQSASIAGVLLGLAHGLVLIPDTWTHFTPWDVLVPFGSYYKTSLSAIGQLSLYLSAIVSFSFWFRSAIGTKTWKYIHYTAFVAYAGALWHGLMMGTDAGEPWLLATYLATSVSVVFALMVRVTYRRPAPRRAAAPPAQGARAA